MNIETLISPDELKELDTLVEFFEEPIESLEIHDLQVLAVEDLDIVSNLDLLAALI